MGKKVRNTEDGLPIFGSDSGSSDVEVADGLPILKKKPSGMVDSPVDASTGGTPIFSQYTSSSDRQSGFATAGGNTKPTTVSLTPTEIPNRVPDPSFSNMLNQPNVLDHDIAANNVFTLSSYNNKPQDPASLQGFNQNQQSLAAGSLMPSYSEESIHKAAEIKNNPDALKDYRKTRMQDIDGQISELEATKQPTVGYLETGQRISQEPQPVDDQIKQLKDYKDQLQKSVAEAALISVPKQVYAAGKDLNIEEVGKKYLQTIGDPTVADDEKTLKELPTVANASNATDISTTTETIKNKLFQQGANALSAYHLAEAEKVATDRSVKINEFLKLKEDVDKDPTIQNKAAYSAALKDPDIQQYADNATKALHYDNEARTSSKYYPQVARQELRQTLNDKFFDLVTKRDEASNKLSLITPVQLALQAALGETPSEEDITKLAKETGKPVEEVRNIVNTPVTGLFGTAPQGVRVTGLATGISEGMDETLANSLNGMRRFFNVPNVNAKNALLQTRSDAYNMSASQNSLQDKQGNLNFNPYSITNMAGRGVGQMAIFALPTMVTGGFAEGLVAPEIAAAAKEGTNSFLATATTKSAEGLTTLATGYIGSYEPAYKDISAYTADEQTRRSYANAIALENAAPELIYSPADIAKNMGLGELSKDALIKNFVNTARKDGVEAAFSQRLKAAAKTFGEEHLAENLEEQYTNLMTNKTDEQYMGKVKTAKELADQFVSTVASTSISLAPMSIGGGMGAFHDAGGLRRHSFFEAGVQKDETLAKLGEMHKAGLLDDNNYNTRVSIVNQMANIVANLPTENIHGQPLDYEQKTKLAAAQYRIDLNKKLQEKSNNEGAVAAQADLIKEDTKNAVNEQKDILTAPIVKGEPENISQPIELNPEITSATSTVVPKPTEQQIANDIKNKDFASFTFKSMDEVPDELKNRVSSYGETNGETFVKVTLPKSEFDYYSQPNNPNGENQTATTTGGSTGQATDPAKESQTLPSNESPTPQETASEVPAGDRGHAEVVKTKFREQFKSKGISDEHIDGAIALMDARAKSWASEEKGRKAEDWYSKIADVSDGDFSVDDVQYQSLPKPIKRASKFAALMYAALHLNAGEISKHIQYRDDATTKTILNGIANNNFFLVNDSSGKVEETETDPKYSPLQKYVNNLWEKAGYPKIQVDLNDKERSHFNPLTNTITLTRGNGLDNNGDDGKLYASSDLILNEIAHALQSTNGEMSTGRAALDFMKSGLVYDNSYNVKGTIENEAHREITPRLQKEFNQILNAIRFQQNDAVKKGALETLKGGRVIIHALTNPDFSTMVHEIGHVFEKDLTAAEKKVVEDAGGSEVFARGFERYLRDGKAPSKELGSLFGKFKNWLSDIYQSLKGSPIEKKVSPEIKKIFDRLLTENKPTVDESQVQSTEKPIVKADEGTTVSNEPQPSKESSPVETATGQDKQGAKQENSVADFKKDKGTQKIKYADAIDTVLKEDKSLNEIQVATAEVFKKVLSDAHVYAHDNFSFGEKNDLLKGEDYGATIDHEGGNILVFKKGNFEYRTLIHEAAHLLSFRALNEYFPEYNPEFKEQISGYFEAAKAKLGDNENYSYAFNNIDEFVAEAFGNADFQAELSYIPSENGKSANIFKGIIKSIRDLVKSLYNYDINSSLLEDIMSSVENANKGKLTTNTKENASVSSEVPKQEVPKQSSEQEHARTSQEQNKKTQKTNDSNSPVGSKGKPKEKIKRPKAHDVLYSVAQRIQDNGILPSWAKATLPDGTQQQGFGEKELSAAIAKALRLTGDAIKKGSELSEAISNGVKDLLDYYKSNNVSVDEDAIRKGFEQEVKDRLKAAKQKEQADEAKKKVNKSANRSYANFTVRMADLLNSDKTITPEQIIATLGKVTEEQKKIIYEQYEKRRSKEEAGLATTKKWVGDLFDALANGTNISKSAFNIAKSDYAHILDLVADKFIEYKVVSNRKLEKFADKAIELFKDDYAGAIDYVEKADKLGEAKPILLAKLAVKLDEAGKGKDAAKVMQKLIATATFTARTLQSFQRVNEILNVKGSPQYKTELAKRVMEKAKEMSDARVREVEEDFSRQLKGNQAEIQKYKDQLDVVRNKAHKSTLSSIREKMDELVNKICNTRRK